MVNVSKFVKEHAPLCTLGLAVFCYLGYHAVSIIKNKCTKTETIDQLSQISIGARSDINLLNSSATSSIVPNSSLQVVSDSYRLDGSQEKKFKKLEKVSEQVPLAGRTEVLLPANKKYLPKWEEIGITWLESVDKNQFLVEALLPEGWESRFNPSNYPDHQHVTLLDEDQIPRVNMFIKTSPCDKYASASFLTKEEGELQLHREIKKANTEKKQKEEAEFVNNFIINHRSETWSEESPYGVFFIKNMSQLRNSGYVKESERRACHGFFPTEETANDAKEWLKKNCCRREDDVFKQKVDSKLLYFIEENGYKTVNGFIDKAWWCARDW